MGTDGAGIVLAVGSEVRHVKVGDRVAGMVHGASSRTNGTAAEVTIYDAALLWAMPEGMSFTEGAAITATHLTAVQTLYMRWDLARPSKPDTSEVKKILLVWGGATAVGHHAIQLAHLSGYRVFVTAAPDHHSRLMDMGAERCFDYRNPDIVQQIREAAGEQGIFAAYDTPASNKSTESCIDAIGPSGGRVMSTLPPSEEVVSRRLDVELEFVLVYTLVGYAFKFANAFDFPANANDRKQSYEWVTEELPAIFAGWEEGQGSSRYTPQALRVGHGLERVHEGIAILGRGSYKAEKLVYTIV
ncbi:hypothetical protein FFLO_05973 [Filobasidium floriforme]|uniref:Enoyl reductase (ER) domain-containing protein n=1 Tax=Filobasidium floriforme TaxID=5210 RepID=A0A8K0NL01_9TREE|nr:hypothetical protein FFLO_05973 [Filobasidium floriforme]